MDEEFDYASAPNLLDGYDAAGEKVGETERKERRVKEEKGTSILSSTGDVDADML